jgi:hypothetical protein
MSLFLNEYIILGDDTIMESSSSQREWATDEHPLIRDYSISPD